MAFQTAGNPTRLELTRMIASIREAYGLSIREYANVVGVPVNSMRRYAFSKGGTVTPETFGNMVAPFSFGFSPELLPKPMSQSEGGKKHWGGDSPPPGYVYFEPVQKVMLDFKLEQNSSWGLLAEHFGWERKQLTNLFTGKHVEGKKFMKKEHADFFMKQIRKANSLSPQRRDQVFAKRTRNPEKFYDRSVIIQMIDNYMQDYDIDHMGLMAEEIGVAHRKLRHYHSNSFPRVRVGTVQALHDKIREARVVREKRINHRHSVLNRTYMADDLTEKAS